MERRAERVTRRHRPANLIRVMPAEEVVNEHIVIVSRCQPIAPHVVAPSPAMRSSSPSTAGSTTPSPPGCTRRADRRPRLGHAGGSRLGRGTRHDRPAPDRQGPDRHRARPGVRGRHEPGAPDDDRRRRPARPHHRRPRRARAPVLTSVPRIDAWWDGQHVDVVHGPGRATSSSSPARRSRCSRCTARAGGHGRPASGGRSTSRRRPRPGSASATRSRSATRRSSVRLVVEGVLTVFDHPGPRARGRP